MKKIVKQKMQHKMCLCQQQVKDTGNWHHGERARKVQQYKGRYRDEEMNEEQVPPNKRTTSRLSRELPGDGNVVILLGSYS